MKLHKPLIYSLILLMSAISCRKQGAYDPVSDAETDHVVVNIENPTVKSYLDILQMQPYRDGDYSYSVIDDYYAVTTKYRKDHPAPATISWNRDERSLSQKVYVSEDPSFSSPRVYPVKNSLSSFDIYNAVPGHDYYWKVTARLDDDSQVQLANGSFSAVGRRCFLNISNVCNVRDLGGIPARDGSYRIKYGMLFRSGEMDGAHKDLDDNYCHIDADGIVDLTRAGVKAVLDLRTDSEAQNVKSSPLGDDVTYVRFGNANTYMYDKFWTSDVYIRAVQWMIDALKQGRPVIFHCIYGADRTGTLAFIVEALLGVDQNQLAIDYEMTSFSYGLDTYPRRRGPKNPLSVYRYRNMVETILSDSDLFRGATLQKKIYNFLSKGCPSDQSFSYKIPSADLDWFIENMLEENLATNSSK